MVFYRVSAARPPVPGDPTCGVCFVAAPAWTRRLTWHSNANRGFCLTYCFEDGPARGGEGRAANKLAKVVVNDVGRGPCHDKSWVWPALSLCAACPRRIAFRPR